MPPRRADLSDGVLWDKKTRGLYILYPKLQYGINLLMFMYCIFVFFHSRVYNIVQISICNEISYSFRECVPRQLRVEQLQICNVP
jgi:hypothetical protein